MFQLTKEELKNWIFQFGISNSEKMGLRTPPYAFTEQGIAMLSGILKSNIAIKINIQIMRTFVELRKTITANQNYKELKEKIKTIEYRIDTLSTNNIVDGILIEKKLSKMNTDIHHISDILDSFQESYIVIKRPDNTDIANL